MNASTDLTKLNVMVRLADIEVHVCICALSAFVDGFRSLFFSCDKHNSVLTLKGVYAGYIGKVKEESKSGELGVDCGVYIFM